MKLSRCLLMIALFTSSAYAAEPSPVRGGVFFGVGAAPFPSVFGVNGFMELAGAARLYLGFDAGKWAKVFTDRFSGFELSAGAGVQLRVPRIALSPTVGLHYSANKSIGSPSVIYDDFTTTADFWVAQLGLEYQFSGDWFVAAGNNFPWIRRDPEPGFARAFGFYPYVSLGVTF